MADILITDNGEGADVCFWDQMRYTVQGGTYCLNSDVRVETGLGNAIYISLFDAPSWFEGLKSENERVKGIGGFEAALNDPITAGSMARLVRLAKTCLAWMVESGVASDLKVAARNPKMGYVELDITITEPNAKENSYRILWDQRQTALTNGFRNTPSVGVGLIDFPQGQIHWDSNNFITFEGSYIDWE